MNTYNLERDIKEVEGTLTSQDQTLGKGLLQPFRATNSGSRAVMQATQSEQELSLLNPEPPIVSTGFENRYMQESSNYILSDRNYVVIDKIYKYPFDKSKMNKYIVILLDPDKNYLTCMERTGYEYITESYGYKIGTSYLDELVVGDVVPSGSVVRSGASTNSHGNWQGGVNLKAIYCAYGPTTEDPVVISHTAATQKLVSPLFDEVTIMINDNDIMLNLYGEGENTTDYKTFPDIGESVKNGILFKSKLDRGGYIENVYVNGININSVAGAALRFETNYLHYRGGNFPTRYNNFRINNVNVGKSAQFGIFYEGYEEERITNIKVTNFSVGTAQWPYYLHNTENCTFFNCTVNNESIPEAPENSKVKRTCDVW